MAAKRWSVLISTKTKLFLGVYIKVTLYDLFYMQVNDAVETLQNLSCNFASADVKAQVRIREP